MNISRRAFIGATGATAAVTLGTGPLLSLARAFNSPAAPRYNIVVIMTDDQDADSLAVMRNLMSFPRGSWINFTNAICNDGICAPSRASYLTGLYTRHHGVLGNPYAKRFDDPETLPVWLHNAGYRTALFGKYLFSYGKVVGIPAGWDIFQELEIGLPGVAANVGQLAIDFIHETTEPFYLHVATRDPHMRALPQEQYADADVWLPPDPPGIGEDTGDKVSWVNQAQLLTQPATVLRAERTRAHRALLGVDDMVVAIIEALEARDILEKTVICYVSDNGFLWGEHGLDKKHWHYEEVIRIPMLIRYPGLAGNREENRVVGVVDLAETFTGIAGTVPGRATDGHSLRPLIETPSSGDDRCVLLERYPDSHGDFSFTGVRLAGWTYVEFHNGEKEMYDLAADPYQLENIAGRHEYEPVEAELRDRMLALLSSGGEPTATPTPTLTPSATPTPTPGTPTATPTPVAGHCNPPVPGNLVRNPGFETGKLYWKFITNGRGRFALTGQNPYQCANAARIKILKAGSNVQLYQNGVRLRPGTACRLSLAACSTTGREIEISLVSAKNPAVNYGLSAVKLSLTPAWKVYTIDFTTTGFTNAVANGRLSISLSRSNIPGEEYYFDDFVLV